MQDIKYSLFIREIYSESGCREVQLSSTKGEVRSKLGGGTILIIIIIKVIEDSIHRHKMWFWK